MADLPHLILLVGLFVLRVGVPLAVIAGLGYGLKRLDERWQAEAVQQNQRRLPPATRRPERAPEAVPMLASAPCWVQRNCAPAQRVDCPAWLRPELPCWLARMEVESHLPSPCADCPSFLQTVGQD